MKIDRIKLKEKSKEIIKKDYVELFTVSFVAFLFFVAICLVPYINIFLIFLFLPLEITLIFIYNNYYKNKILQFNDLLYLYKTKDLNLIFKVCMVAFLKKFMIVLWSLLLIVPGVIKNLEYSAVNYLVAEDISKPSRYYFKESASMMYGHKLDLFYIKISFLGWFILSILTVGILFVWTIPYYVFTKIQFYEKLKEEQKLLTK